MARGGGQKYLLRQACEPEFNSPRTYTKLGAVACVCNPNTPALRGKMRKKNSQKLAAPAGPVSIGSEQEILSLPGCGGAHL